MFAGPVSIKSLHTPIQMPGVLWYIKTRPGSSISKRFPPWMWPLNFVTQLITNLKKKLFRGVAKLENRNYTWKIVHTFNNCNVAMCSELTNHVHVKRESALTSHALKCHRLTLNIVQKFKNTSPDSFFCLWAEAGRFWTNTDCYFGLFIIPLSCPQFQVKGKKKYVCTNLTEKKKKIRLSPHVFGRVWKLAFQQGCVHFL